MNRYIRGIICLIYTNIRFIIKKFIFRKQIHFSYKNIISPFTEFYIGKGSKLILKKNVRIRSGSKIKIREKAEIKIGENTALNHGCIFNAHKKIEIGYDVQFGPNVLIYDHDHDFRKRNGLRNLIYKTDGIKIGNNVWIGANVIILKGTKIGDNCVVAAGSVLKGKYSSNKIIIQKRENIVNEYCFENK